MENRAIPLPLTLSLLAIATIGIGVFFHVTATSQVLTAGVAVAEERANDTPVTETTLDVAAPNGWKWRQRAESDIAGLEENQSIQHGVLADPLDDTIAYFAAKTYDETTGVTAVSIYRYATLSETFERLYRSEYSRRNARVLHVVGYDHGSLIILVDDGTCGKNAELQALSLADPASGLLAYAPTEALSDLTAQETCE